MKSKILKSMIGLVVIFLMFLYIIKIFMPNEFIMIIENQSLINIGQYIDSHWWLSEICAAITAFITYWLYLCAVTSKWKLNFIQIFSILLTITTTLIIYEFDVYLASALNTIAMIILPAIFKSKLSHVAIVFSIHYISQLLSTIIRNLPLLLTNINFMTIFLMGLECYFWLILFYLYFNITKKEN